EVHFPPIAGALACARTPRALTGRGRCDRIELDFGCARAWLEVRTAGPRRLDIALRAESNMINHEIALVLQLQLKASARLTTDRRRLKLAAVQPQQAPTALPLGRTLVAAGAWRFRLPPGATLNWPHLPWNPYAPPTYRAAPEMATALLRVPIDLRSGRCAVSLEILSA
nr:hypothetical protein [Planctomycetota bacterium]